MKMGLDQRKKTSLKCVLCTLKLTFRQKDPFSQAESSFFVKVLSNCFLMNI